VIEAVTPRLFSGFELKRSWSKSGKHDLSISGSSILQGFQNLVGIKKIRTGKAKVTPKNINKRYR
jgi:hypothetical protein